MGRGVSSGGGQSSLGYLFGSGEPQNSKQASPAKVAEALVLESPAGAEEQQQQPKAPQACAAATANTNSNNYQRAAGQNSDNFVAGRPCTKVQNVPGGGSSLGYLFGSQK